MNTFWYVLCLKMWENMEIRLFFRAATAKLEKNITIEHTSILQNFENTS